MAAFCALGSHMLADMTDEPTPARAWRASLPLESISWLEIDDTFHANRTIASLLRFFHVLLCAAAIACCSMPQVRSAASASIIRAR